MADPVPDHQRRRGLIGASIDRVAGAVVPVVTRSVDADELIQRIDVDALLDRIDVDRLLGRLDVIAVRFVNRVLHRDPASLPAGPASLVTTDAGP